MPRSQACPSAKILSLEGCWFERVQILPLACQQAVLFSSERQGQRAYLTGLPSASLLGAWVR